VAKTDVKKTAHDSKMIAEEESMPDEAKKDKPQMKHSGHARQSHAGQGHQDMLADFKRRLIFSLILTGPVLLLSHHVQQFFGYHFQPYGSDTILFLLSSAVYFYGGYPFFVGLKTEFGKKQPGMMTLVAVAITVAYVYSSSVIFGFAGMDFFWELVTLIDIMLLGHWIEMRSTMGASRALEELAKILPSWHTAQPGGRSGAHEPVNGDCGGECQEALHLKSADKKVKTSLPGFRQNRDRNYGEIMKNAKNIPQMGFLLILMIILGTTCTACASDGTTFGPQTTGAEPLWRLLSACDAVNTNLSRIEADLVDASLALSETGIEGPAARAVLSNLTKADTAVIDCITIDARGTVLEVEPMSFESVKGANLKGQKHVNDTINTRLYSGFHFIRAVEGLHAIDSEMPVFDKNGTFMGAVSIMFNNSRFLGSVLAAFQPTGNSNIWVSKADDATILFDTDPTQALLNKSSSLYQDYPELLKLFDRMSLQRTGYETYEFLDESHGETIKKGCYWTTIPNKGTEMRLVLTLEL
jgi:hypothetical protein